MLGDWTRDGGEGRGRRVGAAVLPGLVVSAPSCPYTAPSGAGPSGFGAARGSAGRAAAGCRAAGPRARARRAAGRSWTRRGRGDRGRGLWGRPAAFREPSGFW